MTDALGTKVTLLKHPTRIVTLAPSLGELAADVLGKNIDRVVGVSEYTDYPAALSKIKSVGSYAHFDLEGLIGLKPDLVIATSDGNSRDQIDHLRELKQPVIVVRTGNFAEIERSILLLSEAMDEKATGEALVARFRRGLEKVDERSRARTKSGKGAPRVLLQLDWNPVVVAGKGTFLDEAIRRVGAVNVYSDIAAYPKPSLEDAIRRDPDVILVLGMERNLKSFENAARDWQRFPNLRAVKEKKIHVIQADAIIRPSMRILEGLSLLEREIYGQ